MKRLIKYGLTLFLLLLVGYNQLFMWVGRGSSSHAAADGHRAHRYACALDVRTVSPEDIFIEEEDRREDEQADFSAASGVAIPYFFADYLPEFGVLARMTSLATSGKQFLSSQSLGHSWLSFQVFRL